MHLLSSSVLTLSLALIAAYLPGALADSPSAIHNVTVDDTDGSPDGRYKVIYSPPDAWKAGSAKGCDGCLVSGIDVSKVQNGTWHEAAYDAAHPQHITATILFQGTAIWLYGMVPHTNSSATSNVFFHTAIDTDQPSGFVNASAPRASKENSTATIDYDAFLVGVAGLNSSEEHNFTLVVGDLRNGQDSTPDMSSIFLLDYVVVTQDNNTIVNTGTSSARALTSNFPSTATTLALSLALSISLVFPALNLVAEV
ncbi:hypothetical protein BN946_scf184601.g18 [Trametes cinnabarina]|uniref:Uncharacterized protein n=1 Tax=Pycnoporus cinnabarinus TaxID=5643 RepID=A0A060S6S1_PYCCI|nr:hypothetical protein BN946_scf184601.g18 [Trametes cinnabarina]